MARAILLVLVVAGNECRVMAQINSDYCRQVLVNVDLLLVVSRWLTLVILKLDTK